MTAVDADPLLRRLERRALAFCVVAAAFAVWARGGSWDVALGVLGGAVLIGVSYWAIRSSIDGILALAMPSGDTAEAKAGGSAAQTAEVESASIVGVQTTESERHAAQREQEATRPATTVSRRVRAVGYGLRFVGRYAVLGVLAYVMLVWLRLHPIGLILGVSSIAVAAAWEAASTLSRTSRSHG